MDGRRLSLFAENLRLRLRDLNGGALSVEVHYLKGKSWFLPGDMPSDKSIRAHLEDARTGKLTHRPARSRRVYAWEDSFSVVVAFECEREIKAPAQAAAKRVIDRIARDSLHQFRATHDELTGLKNRVSFDTDFRLALTHGPTSFRTTLDEVSIDVKTGLPAKPAVFLASLDIDNFKTVNDSFGHGYGDIVLAAFATRLQSILDVTMPKDALFSAGLYRLGGEEFQILLVGALTLDDALAVMKAVCSGVEADPIPTKSEYVRLRAAGVGDGGDSGDVPDHKVTTSIGVAMSSSSAVTDVADEIRRLRRQADLALYSAKIGGKNQVRFFGQILAEHGRINFVDESHGIIAIDIGEEVGVTDSQEFFVFPPTYDGITPFIVGEGRSRKRLGNFPEFRSARISVFEAQREAAFCRVVELEKGVTRVLEGSTLKAVPLGAFKHLIGDHLCENVSADIDEFTTVVKREAHNKVVVVVAVAVPDLQAIAVKRGMSYANRLVAEIVTELLSSSESDVTVSQLDASTLLVSFAISSRADAANRVAGIDGVVEGLVGKERYHIGWACNDPLDSIFADGSNVDWAILVDAAALASKRDEDDDDVTVEFSADTWGFSLARHLDAGDLRKVIDEYNAFSAAGLTASLADTQMAFVFTNSRLKDLEKAEAYYRSAFEREESTEIHRANYGGVLVLLGRYSEAFEMLNELPIHDSYQGILLLSAIRSLDESSFVAFWRRREAEFGNFDSDIQAWLGDDELAILTGDIRRLIQRPDFTQ